MKLNEKKDIALNNKNNLFKWNDNLNRNEKKKAEKNKGFSSLGDVATTIGKNRSFAMTEAHKRLRTNIMFSFADESECHIVGVTSTMAHEGKSTTSINLAYDLMKAGKKTLLIDADMRLSHIPDLLGVEAVPGLSNMLVAKNGSQNVIRTASSLDGLQLIPCGNIPPNPTELLSSKRFELMLNVLKESYEYIIVDLPPVSEVSDALIASKLVDGMVVVVRQEYVDKRLLDDTIHQLNLSGAHIIGLVMTCAQYKTKYGKTKHKKSSYEYAYAHQYNYQQQRELGNGFNEE